MIQKREECNIVDNVEKNSYVKKQITNALLKILKEKKCRFGTIVLKYLNILLDIGCVSRYNIGS